MAPGLAVCNVDSAKSRIVDRIRKVAEKLQEE
jgi:hypothetical protein